MLIVRLITPQKKRRTRGEVGRRFIFYTSMSARLIARRRIAPIDSSAQRRKLYLTHKRKIICLGVFKWFYLAVFKRSTVLASSNDRFRFLVRSKAIASCW